MSHSSQSPPPDCWAAGKDGNLGHTDKQLARFFTKEVQQLQAGISVDPKQKERLVRSLAHVSKWNPPIFTFVERLCTSTAHYRDYLDRERKDSPDRFPTGDIPANPLKREGDRIYAKLIALDIEAKAIGTPINDSILDQLKQRFANLSVDEMPAWNPRVSKLVGNRQGERVGLQVQNTANTDKSITPGSELYPAATNPPSNSAQNQPRSSRMSNILESLKALASQIEEMPTHPDLIAQRHAEHQRWLEERKDPETGQLIPIREFVKCLDELQSHPSIDNLITPSMRAEIKAMLQLPLTKNTVFLSNSTPYKHIGNHINLAETSGQDLLPESLLWTIAIRAVAQPHYGRTKSLWIRRPMIQSIAVAMEKIVDSLIHGNDLTEEQAQAPYTGEMRGIIVQSRYGKSVRRKLAKQSATANTNTPSQGTQVEGTSATQNETDRCQDTSTGSSTTSESTRNAQTQPPKGGSVGPSSASKPIQDKTQSSAPKSSREDTQPVIAVQNADVCKNDAIDKGKQALANTQGEEHQPSSQVNVGNGEGQAPASTPASIVDKGKRLAAHEEPQENQPSGQGNVDNGEGQAPASAAAPNVDKGKRLAEHENPQEHQTLGQEHVDNGDGQAPVPHDAHTRQVDPDESDDETIQHEEPTCQLPAMFTEDDIHDFINIAHDFISRIKMKFDSAAAARNAQMDAHNQRRNSGRATKRQPSPTPLSGEPKRPCN